MNRSSRLLRSLLFTTPCLALAALAACAGEDPRSLGGESGMSGMGQSSAGNQNAGGSPLPEGVGGSGTGGLPFNTGTAGAPSGSGGVPGSFAGSPSSEAGSAGLGHFGGGGSAGVGGEHAGGAGGHAGTTTTTPTSGSAGGATVDACAATTELTGGTQHSSSNASGTAAGLDWTIWSNGSGGSITTYTVPAFSAAWNNSGDFLARIGLQWNDTKTYDQYGTINAQFAYKKTGTGGGYSYIGIYGWSVSPCVEYYIVDDSYNKMPVNPGSTTNKGTLMVDGGTYNLYTRPTSGTGGSKCSGVNSWTQFYSVRTTARQCGQISITEHFKAWAAAGMTLGKMDQAQILVEVGGGVGSIDFTTGNITAE